MICPLCSSKLTIQLNEAFFDCSVCRGIPKNQKYFLPPDEEELVYKQHINDVFDERFRAFTKPISSYILDHFLPSQKGLDFGSGTGPVISKVLEENNFTAIEKFDPFFHPNKAALKQKYDFIFACEVVEHFYNPKKEYELLTKMLNKGGSLLIMTLTFGKEEGFDNWLYKNDPTHVFIHRIETFNYLAESYGYKLLLNSKRFFVLQKL